MIYDSIYLVIDAVKAICGVEASVPEEVRGLESFLSRGGEASSLTSKEVRSLDSKQIRVLQRWGPILFALFDGETKAFEKANKSDSFKENHGYLYPPEQGFSRSVNLGASGEPVVAVQFEERYRDRGPIYTAMFYQVGNTQSVQGVWEGPCWTTYTDHPQLSLGVNKEAFEWMHTLVSGKHETFSLLNGTFKFLDMVGEMQWHINALMDKPTLLAFSQVSHACNAFAALVQPSHFPRVHPKGRRLYGLLPQVLRPLFSRALHHLNHGALLPEHAKGPLSYVTKNPRAVSPPPLSFDQLTIGTLRDGAHVLAFSCEQWLVECSPVGANGVKQWYFFDGDTVQLLSDDASLIAKAEELVATLRFGD